MNLILLREVVLPNKAFQQARLKEATWIASCVKFFAPTFGFLAL